MKFLQERLTRDAGKRQHDIFNDECKTDLFSNASEYVMKPEGQRNNLRCTKKVNFDGGYVRGWGFTKCKDG